MPAFDFLITLNARPRPIKGSELKISKKDLFNKIEKKHWKIREERSGYNRALEFWPVLSA